MGKTILITGATSGIGRDAALYLHQKGHRVIATGRNERALAELAEAGLVALPLDVTDAGSIGELKRSVDELTGGEGIDALVNNAGYGLVGPLEILSERDVRAQFETNVFGLLNMTRAFVPQMRDKGAGRVVNISSVGGRMTFPLGGAYHATKYAVEAMSDALRMELRQFGIEVVVIEPGYIDTGFTSTTLGLLDRYKDVGGPYAQSLALADQADESKLARFAVKPRVISKAIERAIVARRPRARIVAPWINSFGPWFRELLPTRLVDWVLRKVAGLVPKSASTEPRALPST
ncbi:MAG: SDR family NAD(P)-dependent oxidoreductase [Sandaracinaceae bacterium]